MDEVFEKPTKDSILLGMDELRSDIIKLAVDLEYFGGFNTGFSEKSKGLIAVSNVIKGWVEDIEDMQ